MTADNIRHEVYKGILILYIDLNPKEPKLSSTGKHLLIATTHGPRPIGGNGLLLGLNLMSKDIPAALQAEAYKRKLAAYRADPAWESTIFPRIIEQGGLRPYRKPRFGKRPCWTEFKESVPLFLRRKDGIAPDEMAAQLGFEGDGELYEAIRADLKLLREYRINGGVGADAGRVPELEEAPF